jgi:hypothetical protein
MALYLKQEAGGEEGNIRGLVENCAHNDDITPLVRLLFEAQSLVDSPSIIAGVCTCWCDCVRKAGTLLAAAAAAVWTASLLIRVPQPQHGLLHR